MTNPVQGRLTPDEVAHYQSQGYVLHRRPVFPDADFARLKEIFEEDLERYGEAGLDVIHFKDPRLMEFLMSDHVLDLVESLIGPDIALWSSHFISKPAKTGKATPWHEDSAYWNGRLDPMSDIVTVWLAIDPAFPENGSMAVIPGTQSGGFSDYEQVDGVANIFGTQVVGVDESKAVYFTLDPNECSLHEGRIIHGAKPNTSEFRRCGYTMRYFPTTTKFFDESPRNAGHRIWLARGKDRAGNRYEN
ncbi:MAG: phytanoyl-CoA dioxygenase family protein [Fimbriimonas sp.]